MTTLPKDTLSCLLTTALSYAKCSRDNPSSCIIYSKKRHTIVSMGFYDNYETPEFVARCKLSWINRWFSQPLYAICTHAPSMEGARNLITMGVKEVYYHTPTTATGLLFLKRHNILATRLLYG